MFNRKKKTTSKRITTSDIVDEKFFDDIELMRVKVEVLNTAIKMTKKSIEELSQSLELLKKFNL